MTELIVIIILEVIEYKIPGESTTLNNSLNQEVFCRLAILNVSFQLVLLTKKLELFLYLLAYRVGQGLCSPIPPSEPSVIVSHQTAQAFRKDATVGRPSYCISSRSLASQPVDWRRTSVKASVARREPCLFYTSFPSQPLRYAFAAF